MKRKIIDLPRSFAQLTNDWIINVRGKSAGEGVTGTGQVAYGAQPRWETTIDLAAIGCEGQRTWNAIQSSMRGRINVLRVPLIDLCPVDLGIPGLDEWSISHIPHSDDTPFSDGAYYAQEPTIVMPSLLEAGAEEMTVDTSSVNHVLEPGMWFSHDDWPYRVTGMWEGEGGATTFAFEPPLRRDIPEGHEVTLQATALMVFETDLEGRMPLERGRLITASVKLLEWTSRP
ncbi:hypothetical protein [Aquamicrobium defluvii]|uniref:Uncharacterized protein n=1 Tax=Aquamicrobium defluvii TaxID=69279 RepID=A0A4R6YEZ4_9HYPH|nr:hypothetical protein [Aquamicrobium defluvii]TDR34661.1 hypothetical protein DES43_11392 [Aquamicrobium defluvii]